MVWSARLKDFVAPIAAAVMAVVAVAIGGVAGLLLVAAALAFGATTLQKAVRARREAVEHAAVARSQVREAKVVAEAARALVASPTPSGPLSREVESALGAMGARLQICHAPAPLAGEVALPLRADGASGWLYVEREGPLSRAEAERLLERLSTLVAAAQERTRQTRADAEAETARQAELAKTTVMHAVSHDLRRPLDAVKAVASVLAEDHVPEHERRQLAAALAREAAGLERLSDDLLDLSRITAGATNPQMASCNLASVLAGAVRLVDARRESFNVHVDLAPDLPPIQADPVQLERVFTNLLENAATFCPSAEPVEVRGMCANGRVTIRVLDRGRGIAPAEQSQVFKAFVRGSG